MTTEWVVTTAAERLSLNAQRQGEMTFTVTNPTNATDRAVFDIVPGEGADTAWFQVDEPQRPVRGTSSVSYLVRAVVPAQASAGDYAIQGRVYSADLAPEESSVLSSRVMVEVRPAPAPKRPRIPWWVFVVIGLVVIAIVVTVVVVVATGSPSPAPSASATGSAIPSGPSVVPDVSKLSVSDATAALAKAGLQSQVKYKQDPPQNGHIDQSIPAGTHVERGSTVDLTVHVSMQPPQQIGPVLNARTSVNPLPVLIWKDPDAYVHDWEVRVFVRTCFIGPIFAGNPCSDILREDVRVGKPSYQPLVRMQLPPAGALGVYDNSFVYWQIIPYDDFGTAGPGTPSWGFSATG